MNVSIARWGLLEDERTSHTRAEVVAISHDVTCKRRRQLDPSRGTQITIANVARKMSLTALLLATGSPPQSLRRTTTD